MSVKSFIRDRVIASSDVLMDLYLWASSARAGRRDLSRGRFVQDTPERKHRFFIDLTCFLYGIDGWSGIPRFIAYMFLAWLDAPPEGFEVVPVCFDGHALRDVKTDNIRDELLSSRALTLLDEAEAAAGDVFFTGQEFVSPIVSSMLDLLRVYRAHGVKIYVTHHVNILGHPEPYSPFSRRYLKKMFFKEIDECDGSIAISQWTADALIKTAAERKRKRSNYRSGCTICLGADIGEREMQLVRSKPDVPTFIMVGSLYYHKGYTQAVDAFRSLWANGEDVRLIIVGKKDLNMPNGSLVYEKIRCEAQRSDRLEFLEGASDDALFDAYSRSSAIICASWFDNHNMPMIEAANYGVPVIARDFPVFREIAGDSAFYFQGREPEDLANAIKEWMRLDAEDRAPKPDGIKLYTWAESAKEWSEIIFGGRWYREGI